MPIKTARENKVREAVKSVADRIASLAVIEVPARQLFSKVDAFPTFSDHHRMVLIMKRVLEKNSNCIDVGANRGEVFRHIMRLAPIGEHRAFEPVSELAERLELRYKDKPNVHVHNLALSDAEGTAKFFIPNGLPNLASLADWTEIVAQGQGEWREIGVSTIDHWSGGDRVNLLKIDVEGAELGVMRGGIRCLASNRPYVFFEVNRPAALKLGFDVIEIFDVLTEARLSVNTLNGWLHGSAPLERAAYADLVEEGACDFLAYPG